MQFHWGKVLQIVTKLDAFYALLYLMMKRRVQIIIILSTHLLVLQVFVITVAVYSLHQSRGVAFMFSCFYVHFVTANHSHANSLSLIKDLIILPTHSYLLHLGWVLLVETIFDATSMWITMWMVPIQMGPLFFFLWYGMGEKLSLWSYIRDRAKIATFVLSFKNFLFCFLESQHGF